MKRVLMALLAIVALAGLALAQTNVSVKCYPDQYAYNWAGGWSQLRDRGLLKAINAIYAQTDAKTTYTWGTGYWTSTKTNAYDWIVEMRGKFGSGTKTAPKLGMTYNRIRAGGSGANGYDAVVEYYEYTRFGTDYMAGLIMHELGHAMGKLPHCSNYCVMQGNYASCSYCTSCRNTMNAAY